MSGERSVPARQGMLDTSILMLRRWIDPAELPDEMAISAITLAELSAGPHQVRPSTRVVLLTRPPLPQEKDADRRE